jgi:FAD/FMN-containing dehydrogenase
MPASFVVKTAFYTWALVSFWMARLWEPFAKQQHDTRVRGVQAQVKEWIARGSPNKLCSARPGWKTMSLRIGKYKSSSTGISVGHLSHILKIDAAKRTVHVEPNVTMGQLTASLNSNGWTLPVLPELDDLTVGGLVCGVGVETSSHKFVLCLNHSQSWLSFTLSRFGLFQHICKQFEIVLADGSVAVCSAQENPDLFRAIPWYERVAHDMFCPSTHPTC